ncbi:MAG: sporulation protein YqfD [Clostridia bacterium]|nr:sporulation protein YqfD [Clostridia bacterium]
MKGEVRLLIRGLMPEKLMERAMDMGVRFRRVKTGDDHTFVADVSERDARKLLKLCQRFSIPAEVLKRRGASAFRRWLRRRWTLVPGLMVMALLIALALGRIWRVEVRFTGNAAERGDAGTFIELLNERGLRPGAGRDIDTAALADELLAEAGEYSYVSARVQGVVLQIEAAPEVEAPEVYDVDAPRSLYADRTGIVVSVNVEAGEPCVKPGDTVRKGQLLIRGAEKVAKEDSRAIAALGEVVVRAWYEGHAEGALTAEQARYTGRQSTSSALQTPWFEWRVAEGETFARQSATAEDVPIGGLFVPVKLRRVINRETELVREEGDRELLSSRLVALAMADARARLTAFGPVQYKIARSWVRYTQPTADTLRASAVCEIYTNAAAPYEALRQGG